MAISPAQPLFLKMIKMFADVVYAYFCHERT